MFDTLRKTATIRNCSNLHEDNRNTTALDRSALGTDR